MKTLFNEKQKSNLNALLQEALYNKLDPPPDEVVVFRIDYQNIGSLGNFALLTGLPKAGKGKYICGFSAAALSRELIFNLSVRLPEDKKHVSYYDTEQSRYDHYQMVNMIRTLMQQDELPPHFASYHCRRHDAQTIIPMIEYELSRNPNIGIIILDGLLDLIDSFNDEKQSKQLVNFLKRITDVYNVFVLGVLHRSKSVDKSMGHLGSAADRAAQSVLVVEKNKDTRQYILRGEYLRNADDFAPIAIYYNKQLRLWEQTDLIDESVSKPTKQAQPSPRELDISVHSLNVLRIFNTQAVQSYESLVQNIREIYGRGRNWSVDCVKHLTQEVDMVFKTETGYTNVRQARLYLTEKRH